MIRTTILFVVALGVLVQIVKMDSTEENKCNSGENVKTPVGMMMGMEPKCDENGKYMYMQCFKSSKYCACFDKHGMPITEPLSTLKGCKCLVKKYKREKSGMIGSFVPQCEEDGTYKKQQCHFSTGYCFCADPITGKNTTVPARGDQQCD